MSLGRSAHRLCPRITDAHGLSCFQRRHRQIGLHAHIKFRAKSASYRRRHNADLGSVHAQHSLQPFEIHNRGLRTGMHLDPAIYNLGKTGFGLDIAMLDKAALETPLNCHICLGQSGLCIAAFHKTAAHNVIVSALVQLPCTTPLRGLNILRGWQFRPSNRHIRRVDRPQHIARADQGGHRIACITGFCFGKDGLVFEARNNTKAVFALHICGRQNSR